MSTPIQIDSALSASFYRLCVIGGFCALLLVVIWLLPFGWAYQLALVLFLGACVWFAQVKQPHLTAISSLLTQPSHDGDYDFLQWHIQTFDGYFITPYGYENDVYQATLQKIDDMGVVLILTFDVFEPFDKIYRLAIWQDQVDSESWRMLKILAKVR
nr:protein YgfX [uncultured Moraxella sp.]